MLGKKIAQQHNNNNYKLTQLELRSQEFVSPSFKPSALPHSPAHRFVKSVKLHFIRKQRDDDDADVDGDGDCNSNIIIEQDGC